MIPQPKHILPVLALFLAVASPGAAALAQDTNIIGPPALRDFTISGERSATPPPAEQPADVSPPPVAVPEQSATPVEAQPDRPAPAAETVTQSPSGQERQDSVRRPSDAAPAPAIPSAAAPVTESLPVPVTTEVPTSGLPAPAGSGISWLYIFLGVVGAGFGLLILLRLSKGMRGRAAEAPVADELLLVEPAPAQAPAPRPWLELEFKPGKAAATESQASVEYELRIANVGDADARKVRIEARLFNAQQDREIGAFFSAPDPAQAAASPRAIPPEGGVVFKSVVALPKDEVREVIIQGRRLFIPMVAFNVLYEWGEGEAGQTSMSYIVGRETEPPAEKMAPFRLDLGPRIYRSVGFRPSTMALTV